MFQISGELPFWLTIRAPSTQSTQARSGNIYPEKTYECCDVESFLGIYIARGRRSYRAFSGSTGRLMAREQKDGLYEKL